MKHFGFCVNADPVPEPRCSRAAAAQVPENSTQKWQGAQKSEDKASRWWSGLLLNSF